MSASDHFMILYSIIIGLAILAYIQKWAELVQMRQYSLYVTVPILWSIAFVIQLLNQWVLHLNWTLEHRPFTLIVSLSIPSIYCSISYTLFPSKELLDRKDKFAYLDYYEHFRQNIRFVIGFALLAFFLTFLESWLIADQSLGLLEALWRQLLFQQNYLLLSIFGIAFFAEHKGLVCVLAYFLLAVLLYNTLS